MKWRIVSAMISDLHDLTVREQRWSATFGTGSHMSALHNQWYCKLQNLKLVTKCLYQIWNLSGIVAMSLNYTFSILRDRQRAHGRKLAWFQTAYVLSKFFMKIWVVTKVMQLNCITYVKYYEYLCNSESMGLDVTHNTCQLLHGALDKTYRIFILRSYFYQWLNT